MGDKVMISLRNQHYLEPENNITGKCSCAQCESLFCFAKRHLCLTCMCEKCSRSNTCLYYNNRKGIKESYSDQITAVYLNATKSTTTDRETEDMTESDINYELERKRVIETNQPPPNSVEEYVRRLLLDTAASTKYRNKSDKLSGYIDIISENSQFKNKQESVNKYIKDLKQSRLSENFNTPCAKTGRCKGKCNKCKSKNVTQVQSVMLSCPLVDLTPGTAKLSAQVMNVPYETFDDSVSCKPSDLPSFKDDKNNNKYDILKKLKEAYNACSCKICECIPTQIFKSDICNCKPCDCVDCMRYMNALKTPKIPKPSHDLRCTCSRINSRCKTHLRRKQKECSCKPCNCAQCQNSDFAKPCDCEPCQCIQCKPTMSPEHKNLVVAPVKESYQHSACQCSPCDCVECVRGYSVLSRNYREVSTCTERHARCSCSICLNENCDQGDEPCKCERYNVMHKSVDQGRCNFDVRASIINDIYHHGDDITDSKIQDMIAMFAALPRLYPNFGSSNINNVKSCSCEECECLTCVCKEDTINAIKSSKLFSCDKSKSTIDENTAYTTKHSYIKYCDCKPCECQVCNKYKKAPKPACSGLRSDFSSEYCDSKSKYKRDRCKCSTCRCERCFGDDYEPPRLNVTDNKVHPIKKGDVLTPSAHQTKVQKLMLAKGYVPTTSATHRRESLHQYITFKEKYQPKESSRPIQLSTLTQTNRNEFDFGTDLVELLDESNTLKRDGFVQCQGLNNETFLHENSITDKTSGSYISVYSSIETSSKTSLCKENDKVTAILGNKNNSWESSCNSSGHDHPTYLIQLPKSTVETCLEDVLKSDVENDIKLKAFEIKSARNYKILEKRNLSHQCDKTLTDMATSFSTSVDTKSESIQAYTINKGLNLFENTHNNKEYFRKNIVPKDQNIDHDKDSPYFKGKYAIRSYSNSNHAHRLFKSKNYVPTPSLTIKGKESSNIYSHVIQNLNQVHLARNSYNLYNLPNEELPEFMRDEDCWDKPRQSHVYFQINISDSLNMDDDYKRVHKTLKDAKEFSVQLLKLLETYEKANKEFEKISDKLIVSHEPVSNEESTKNLNKYNINENIDNSAETPCLRMTATPLLDLAEKHILPENVIAGSININTVSQKNVLSKASSHTLKPVREISEKNQSVHRTIEMETRESGTNLNIASHNHMQNRPNSEKLNIIRAELDDHLVFQNVKEVLEKTNNDRIRKKNCKSYNKLLRRTNNIPKKVCLKKPNKNYTPTAESAVPVSRVLNIEQTAVTPDDYLSKDEEIQSVISERRYQLSQIMGKLDPIFGSTEEISMATSTDKLRETKDSPSRKEIEDKEPWSMLNKNFSFDGKPGIAKKIDEVHGTPSLKIKTEETAQSVPLQTNSTRQMKDHVSYYENNALNQLQIEIRKLLELAIFQPQNFIQDNLEYQKETSNVPPKSKLELELKEPQKVNKETGRRRLCVDKEVSCSNLVPADDLHTSTEGFMNEPIALPFIQKQSKIDNGNCEDQKVKFLVVRKVSDHTVLVKWSKPQEHSDVLGYELLVDGRAVHKVFNPSRCMAVVTCLPHTDKILLTIRTLTSTVSEAGYCPATTIVYRPRVK